MRHFSLDRIKVLVTSHCNLNCKHCYQYFDKNRYSLSKKQLFEIVDFACENGAKILDFSGGEFFVHPNAYEVLEYCFSKKILVNVATNAINIRTEFFEKYKNSDLLTIQVSIDGTKESHDQRRGDGTWDKTIKHVKELQEIGIPLTASMTLDIENYKDAIDVLQLPYFTNFIFSPVAYAGAATVYSSTENQEEYEETISYLMQTFEGDEESFADQIFPKVLSIKYDGGVYISPLAGDYDMFCFGNINKNNIEDICYTFYQSDKFKQISTLNVMEIEECNRCEVSDLCNRGCRLRALKFYGDILKPDPFYCKIFLNKFSDIAIGRLFWGIR